MDRSALPYLEYFLYKFIIACILGYVGHKQRRALLLFVEGWLAVSMIRYGLIVVSAGDNPWLFQRADVVTLIRWATSIEAKLFFCAGLVFVWENIQIEGNRTMLGDFVQRIRKRLQGD